MLQKLFISNYVIIDELETIFQPGLNVITGETGAGKSIIAGALGLILGDRADTAALVNKSRKCIIEGSFKPDIKTVKDFLASNELDITEDLIIRREIAINGKTRAFINDTPVTLSQLQELGNLLVDLHRQFDTLDVGHSGFQLEVIDALAAHDKDIGIYRESYDLWQALKAEAAALQLQQQQFEKEADYNRFQFEELDKASFKENELEDTEAELKLLNNAGEIRTALEKACYSLDEGENPLVQQLKSICNQLSSYSSFHPQLESLVQRLLSAQVEIQDVAGDLDKLARHVSFDAERINELNERLSEGYRLLKKHSVKSTAELLSICQELENKLQAVLDTGELLSEKIKATKAAYEKLLILASKISAARKKQIPGFEKKVNNLLARVGMPNALLRVNLVSLDQPSSSGMDLIEFLFDANVPKGDVSKSAQLQPLKKVASGGELSRLMLCIKSLVAESIQLPTMIFDEIDIGISGEAAKQVAEIMKQLGSSRQVICITHQPQIAARADAHFFVYKEVVKDQVLANIRVLNTDERIEAIAKMLGGDKPTAAAMQNAREMLVED